MLGRKAISRRKGSLIGEKKMKEWRKEKTADHWYLLTHIFCQDYIFLSKTLNLNQVTIIFLGGDCLFSSVLVPTSTKNRCRQRGGPLKG